MWVGGWQLGQAGGRFSGPEAGVLEEVVQLGRRKACSHTTLPACTHPHHLHMPACALAPPACLLPAWLQRASLEARQQDIRDKQAAVQQSAEYVEKLKVSLLACPAWVMQG